MIPHALGPVSRPQCALVVAVILPPIIIRAVASARDPRRPSPALAPAAGTTVHVSAVAPSVHPELATAVATSA
jgi:hypothetical protein